jgi:hypothetical protein
MRDERKGDTGPMPGDEYETPSGTWVVVRTLPNGNIVVALVGRWLEYERADFPPHETWRRSGREGAG